MSQGDVSQKKMDAIYELRLAAERKALAEKALSEKPSHENRYKLLDKMLDLEAKTATAIEECHECGHAHEPGDPHGAIS